MYRAIRAAIGQATQYRLQITVEEAEKQELLARRSPMLMKKR
jgi:hypothetical protein